LPLLLLLLHLLYLLLLLCWLAGWLASKQAAKESLPCHVAWHAQSGCDQPLLADLSWETSTTKQWAANLLSQ
jgi:hypothetical protein